MLQPSLPYNLLKFALQLFGRPPVALEADEYKAVRRKAEAECALQVKMLASPEGMGVVVADRSIQEAMAALGERYETPESFERDLEANDLDLKSMAAALAVDLAVEATITQVAARVAPPSKAEVVEVFGRADSHKPEQRRLRHILITINDQFPENRRQAAQLRIATVRDQALAPGVDFGALAQRYSECPSALQGGSIGPVVRGGIYPSLADVLFAMAEGEISEVVESNMGLHVLLCEEVIPAEKVGFEQVRSKIRKALHGRARKKAVQEWLATL